MPSSTVNRLIEVEAQITSAVEASAQVSLICVEALSESPLSTGAAVLEVLRLAVTTHGPFSLVFDLRGGWCER